MELDRQPRAAGAGELLGVQTRFHAADARGGQDEPRLCEHEGAAIAEDVAELGQPTRGHGGHHPPNQQVQVGIRLALVLGWHHVRAQKRSHQFERPFAM